MSLVERLNGFAPNSQGRLNCLVPRSDEFECQGQRSKVKVTRDKKKLSTPVTSGSVQMVCTRYKQHASAADGTIPSLPGVISGACVRFMFGKTSLAPVFIYLFLKSDKGRQSMVHLMFNTVQRQQCKTLNFFSPSYMAQ